MDTKKYKKNDRQDFNSQLSSNHQPPMPNDRSMKSLTENTKNFLSNNKTKTQEHSVLSNNNSKNKPINFPKAHSTCSGNNYVPLYNIIIYFFRLKQIF